MHQNSPAQQCLNCGYAFQQEENYCPACGQKSATHRINFHEIGHDALHYFTHADKGIFFLLKKLAVQPGVVAREYIEGKRKKYFKPLNFYLIVAGIVVFMTSNFYTVDHSRSRQLEVFAEKESNPAKKKQLAEIAHRSTQVEKITAKYSNLINMVATPLLAIFFWLGYLRGRYNYVEHLVGNMYFVGFVMLFYAMVVVPVSYYSTSRNSLLMIGFFFLFEITYRGYAYYQFMNKRSVRAAIKAYGISAIVTIIWVSLTVFLISTYIRKGF